jgi:hypothetical protein
MMRSRSCAGFVLGAMLGLTLLPLAASAHSPIATPATTTAGFYDYRWRQNTNVKFKFTPGAATDFHAGNSAITVGAQSWTNNQSGLNMYFGSAWPNNYDPGTCPMYWSNGHVAFQKNGIHSRNISYLGLTYPCVLKISPNDYYELYDANIVFDNSLPNNYTWNMAPSLPSNTQIDLWSVAAHEFGHAAGSTIGGDKLGHFVGKGTDGHGAGRDLGACPGGPDNPTNDSTMCNDGLRAGEYWQWDLATHDIHTVESAY